MKKLLIITEGGRRIGLGHITRCTALYQAAEEAGWSPSFALNADESALPLVEGLRAETFDWLRETGRIFSAAAAADAVIVDSYLASPEFCGLLADKAPAILWLDDNNRIPYPRGIVANGTIFAERMVYPEIRGLRYLRGSGYIPLRRAFWDVHPVTARRQLESILITFGGDDLRNLTPGVLAALNTAFPGAASQVVIGRSFQPDTVRQIRKAAAGSRTELIMYPDAEAMCALMREADLAVSAGGQTLYELARCGVPAIAALVADNQAANVANWWQAGFILNAGRWDDPGLTGAVVAHARRCLPADMRRQMAAAGRSLVDGQGARRLIEELSRQVNHYGK